MSRIHMIRDSLHKIFIHILYAPTEIGAKSGMAAPVPERAKLPAVDFPADATTTLRFGLPGPWESVFPPKTPPPQAERPTEGGYDGLVVSRAPAVDRLEDSVYTG